jgi:hypothetical protein
MGMVIDVGVVSRRDVVAPLQLLLDEIGEGGRRNEQLELLTDANTPGHLMAFNGSEEELLTEFEATDLPGFLIGVCNYRFVSVYPPKSFNTKLEVWRLIDETDGKLDERLLEDLSRFPGVEYVVVSAGETLDLEEFGHVNKTNFPWDHWLLVAAKLNL